MAANVFTYGSLMFADVWQKVVKGHYSRSPGIVHGIIRRKIIGKSYPAAIADSDAKALQGIIYFNLNPVDLQHLDHFEGRLYCREPITVILPSGKCASADIYLLRNRYLSRLSKRDWNPNSFSRRDIKSVLLSR